MNRRREEFELFKQKIAKKRGLNECGYCHMSVPDGHDWEKRKVLLYFDRDGSFSVVRGTRHIFTTWAEVMYKLEEIRKEYCGLK